MNKQEAIKAMQIGLKMTHPYFSANEWITMPNPYTIETEDKYEIDINTFWSDRKNDRWDRDWSIFELVPNTL